MEQIKTIQEMCSLLTKLGEMEHDAAAFLLMHGYDKRPDIVDADEVIIGISMFLEVNVARTQEILSKVYKEQKEKGCTSAAM